MVIVLLLELPLGLWTVRQATVDKGTRGRRYDMLQQVVQIVLIAALVVATSAAFVVVPSRCTTHDTALWLASSSSTRREVLQRTAIGLLTFLPPSVAHATYSAYTHREQDWQARGEKDEIHFSSARDLRQQLRDIAPMNSESSKLFCPNGPSSAVSPLMENRCGDRMAMPSVYGRTQDVVGNSIPGFSVDPRESGFSTPVGGFPSYK